MNWADVTIITGHYGVGKTNLAVNLAKWMSADGPVSLYDLDIVNPYFRSADFIEPLAKLGVTVYAPEAANTNLDLPALSGRLEGALRVGEKNIILDVGGDDAGAIALGRYAALLRDRPYQMWYVVNRFRYMTRTPDEAVVLLREIEAASGLRATHIVNNSNMGPATTSGDLLEGFRFASEISEKTGLPLLFSSASPDVPAAIPDRQDISLYVKLPF